MLKRDIKVAIDLLNDKGEDHLNDKRSPIYGYTNEELDLFLPILPIKDKKVLTVASSGDQILSCALNVAKKIDAFDINPFQIYYSKLKIAAIKALNVKEYNNYFFNKDYKSIFSKELYKKIRLYLDNNTKKFFDELYLNGFEYKFENLVCNFILHDQFIKELEYTKEDNYDITKDNVNNACINYISCDFFKLHRYLKDVYDVMLFSNMYEWFNFKQKEKFLSYVKKLEKHLSDDGIISLYTSVNKYKSNDLEVESKNHDNINIYSSNDEEMITYKKLKK